MFSSSSHLLSSIRIRDLYLANRVALAPMTRARAGKERIPNDLMVKYYRQRAGAGLVITEATTISEQANGWTESPGVYTDEMMEAWKPIVDAVHGGGSRIFMQLWHTGRASHSSFNYGKPPVAPSAIKIEGDGVHTPYGKKPHEVPRALETDEIPKIVADYQRAAERAVKAGFDGVEIHAANGYLLDTFLQSKTNHREDRYGGDLIRRYRILDEVVQAVAEVIETNRISVRLSPNGSFNDMGSPDFRDQFLYVAGQLDDFTLAYLHVIDGLAFGFHKLGEPVTLQEIRQVYKGPLMGNCGYTQETAEKAIAEGHADMIAFGRPFISNPDLVHRFANNLKLNSDADHDVWYSHTGAVGYTDFPTAEENAITN